MFGPQSTVLQDGQFLNSKDFFFDNLIKYIGIDEENVENNLYFSVPQIKNDNYEAKCDG